LTWCACRFSVTPQASQAGCKSFRAWNKYAFRDSPPLSLELAQESEQKRRLMKSRNPSKRPASFRLRSKVFKQVSHCRGSAAFALCCCRIYFFLDLDDDFGAHSSQALGRPINQRLWDGANWPPLAIPAEEPISISPEAV
jgi:hypothetical protein